MWKDSSSPSEKSGVTCQNFKKNFWPPKTIFQTRQNWTDLKIQRKHMQIRGYQCYKFSQRTYWGLHNLCLIFLSTKCWKVLWDTSFALPILTLKEIRRFSGRKVVKSIIYIRSCVLYLIGGILGIDHVLKCAGVYSSS